MHLNPYERKVLDRIIRNAGAAGFETLEILEKKGAIKMIPDDDGFQIEVTEAGKAALPFSETDS